MRHRRVALVASIALIAAGLALPSVAAEGCEWLAGDLHIHTTYSHDSYGGPTDDNTGPDDFYTLGHPPESQFAVAAARGLDYLAITDHNDVRSTQHFDAADDLGVIPVAGYENSLDGHAQMLGATKLYDNGTRSTSDVQRIADELLADGGVFQINHPAEGSTDFPHDTDWAYLWDVVPETVEVWNISRLWQPPMPSGSSNDDAVRFWEGFLNRGYRVGATGGSDNHWVSTTAVQGAGQPTTWVCASERSATGVLEGLRAGRTFITDQPPAHGGARIFLEADADGDGNFESIVGDEVAPGTQIRVRVEGSPGSILRVVSNSEVVAEEPVTSADFASTFVVDTLGWVRAEIFRPDLQDERTTACDGALGDQTTYCRNQLLVLAMTSALFVVEPEPEFDPTTTLTYDGDTSARAGATATLAATLASVADGPLVGETVTFTFREEAYEAVTDASGRAAVEVPVTGPPGDYEVTARYAGSERYLPSEDSATFTVTTGP